MTSNEMTVAEHEAWLAARREGIGGSDAGPTAEVCPPSWGSRMSVFLDKIGKAPPKIETPAMERGSTLEPIVVAKYEKQMNVKTVRHNVMVKKDFQIANLDRLVIPPDEKIAAHRGEIRTWWALEVKTTTHDWGGVVPLTYQAQVNHYFAVCPTLKRIDLVVLNVLSWQIEIYTFNRNDELCAKITELERDLWYNHILPARNDMANWAKYAPPPRTEKDCASIWGCHTKGKIVRLRYSDAEVDKHDLAEINDNKDLKLAYSVKELLHYESVAREAKSQIEALRNVIIPAMEDSEGIVDKHMNTLLTYKKPEPEVVTDVITDWRGIAETLGASQDLIDSYTMVVKKTVEKTRRLVVCRKSA